MGACAVMKVFPKQDKSVHGQLFVSMLRLASIAKGKPRGKRKYSRALLIWTTRIMNNFSGNQTFSMYSCLVKETSCPDNGHDEDS